MLASRVARCELHFLCTMKFFARYLLFDVCIYIARFFFSLCSRYNGTIRGFNVKRIVEIAIRRPSLLKEMHGKAVSERDRLCIIPIYVRTIDVKYVRYDNILSTCAEFESWSLSEK